MLSIALSVNNMKRQTDGEETCVFIQMRISVDLVRSGCMLMVPGGGASSCGRADF